MAESAEYDPMDAVETTPTDPADSGPATDSMGAGLFEQDNPDGGLGASGGQSGEADETHPKSDADRRGNRPDDPELLRADYTRKTQEVAEMRRQLQAERESFQRQQQEWLIRQQEVLQGNHQGATPSEVQQIRQLAADPTLSPQDRAGMNYIAGLAQQVEELSAANRTLAERLESAEPRLQQSLQFVEQMTQREQQQLHAQIASEADEARRLFGQDSIEQHKDFILPLLSANTVNPATGERYTVTELVAKATGRDLEQIRQAQAGNRASRNQARRAVATPTGTPSMASSGGGPISREQAIAEIARLGY